MRPQATDCTDGDLWPILSSEMDNMRNQKFVKIVVWIIAVLVVVVIVLLLGMALAVRIVKQYEEGVLFRFGRLAGERT